MILNSEVVKWKLLLQETEVIYEWTDRLTFISYEDLVKVEKENNMLLPQGYKDFCHIFGPGRFGRNQFKIKITGVEEGEDIEESRQLMIDSYSDIYVNGMQSISREAKEFIENSYEFGQGDGYKSFVFDLSSYNNKDNSCDIYVFYCCMNGYYRYICRDFFEFIKDFCLSNRAELDFSDIFDFRLREDIDDPMLRYGTFSPFPLFLDDHKTE